MLSYIQTIGLKKTIYFKNLKTKLNGVICQLCYVPDDHYFIV